jgi:coenzyme F420-reducing hydrogenase alpha subunit
MSGGFTGEGSIDIALATEGDRIVDVSIANRRPLDLASHLVGLTPNEALHRIAAVFSVCRIAQGLAGSMAVEQALGIDPGPSQNAARALLLRGETVLEHATCVLLDWPVLLGKRPIGFRTVKALRVSLADIWDCIYPDGDWMRPGGGWLAPDKTALTARLDAAEDAIVEARLALPLDTAGWQDWVRGARGPAAELFRLLEQEGWEGCGASGVTLLDSFDETALDRRLAADGDGSFVAQPEWESGPRETGPLARRLADPLVQAVVAQHGRGLAARFLAQCVETTWCLVEMRDLAEEIYRDRNSPIPEGDGVGLGLVEAARGWLAHRVEIADGRIRRYQILAPTEWNFHPRGALARGLMEGRRGAPPEHLAQLMVAALDSCVPCRLKLP